MGSGNAYNLLNSFLLSPPVWLEDGYTACTKRVVPLFPYSAAGSYVLACAPVHISYDCTRALYTDSPTHVSRPTRHHMYTRLFAWMDELGAWKKRILLGGQIAVAFCEKSMWNISVSRWGGQERRRSRGLDATILWWMWWNSLKN